jgi:hypothetical protein
MKRACIQPTGQSLFNLSCYEAHFGNIDLFVLEDLSRQAEDESGNPGAVE